MPDIYLTRLKALREFGIPLAEQKEAEGHLDFGCLAKRKAFLDALIQRRSTPNTP